MTDKEKIKEEIERRFDDNMKAAEQYTENSKSRALFTSAAKEDYDLLAFIDSLPEEPNEDLEEEFNRFLDEEEGVPRMWHSDEQMEWGMDIARHFAECQKQQMKETLQTEYEKGRLDMREEMMKDAVEGEVRKGYVGNQIVVSSKDGISNYVAFDASYADAFCVGDKVKIIIVKED